MYVKAIFIACDDGDGERGMTYNMRARDILYNKCWK